MDSDGSGSSNGSSSDESDAESNKSDDNIRRSSKKNKISDDDDEEEEEGDNNDKHQDSDQERDSDGAGDRDEEMRDIEGGEEENGEPSSANAVPDNTDNRNSNVDIDDDDDDDGNDEARQRLLRLESLGLDMEDDDDEAGAEAGERQEVTRTEAEAPRMKINFKAEEFKSVDYVKLPNFLSIDTQPFDPQTYEDEACDDDRQDDEGRARLKLKVENTIRWRRVVDEDGNEVDRESNARIVRWSDGTCSLYLGDEIFHMTRQSQGGDNNHLFIRDQAGWSVSVHGLLLVPCVLQDFKSLSKTTTQQAQSIFKSKLTFRPSSTDSVTHRKLTLSLADRSQKTQKICVLPSVGIDPDAHRSEMIKKEEDRLKASIRKENQTRRLKDRVYTGRTGINSSFLEDNDEDDESISIAKIKNQYKSGGGQSQSAVYSSSDSDSSDDDFKGKRRH